jgi:hypothetical protein
VCSRPRSGRRGGAAPGRAGTPTRARPLGPARRALPHAGKHLERPAHAHGERHAELVAVPRLEELLLRSAEATKRMSGRVAAIRCTTASSSEGRRSRAACPRS